VTQAVVKTLKKKYRRRLPQALAEIVEEGEEML
jgi:hypothetical protein